MNYSNLTEDISYLARDASYDLAEDRHLAIMEDPHQQWSSRLPRPKVQVDESLAEARTMELDPEIRKKFGKQPHKVASFDSMSHYERAMTNAWCNHDQAQDSHAMVKKIAAKGHAGSENHWMALKDVKHYERKRDYCLRRAAAHNTNALPKNESVDDEFIADMFDMC